MQVPLKCLWERAWLSHCICVVSAVAAHTELARTSTTAPPARGQPASSTGNLIELMSLLCHTTHLWQLILTWRYKLSGKPFPPSLYPLFSCFTFHSRFYFQVLPLTHLIFLFFIGLPLFPSFLPALWLLHYSNRIFLLYKKMQNHVSTVSSVLKCTYKKRRLCPQKNLCTKKVFFFKPIVIFWSLFTAHVIDLNLLFHPAVCRTATSLFCFSILHFNPNSPSQLFFLIHIWFLM